MEDKLYFLLGIYPDSLNEVKHFVIKAKDKNEALSKVLDHINQNLTSYPKALKEIKAKLKTKKQLTQDTRGRDLDFLEIADSSILEDNKIQFTLRAGELYLGKTIALKENEIIRL